MKKLLCLLLLLMLPLWASALTGPQGESIPDAPLWQATIRMGTRLRTEKDAQSRKWLGLIPELAAVDVYAVEEDWCICGYNGEIGYVEHIRLMQFMPLKDEPRPGAIIMEGVATMTDDAFLMVDGYTGNEIRKGDILCVRETGIVPMMRYKAQLSPAHFDFEPFVPADKAQPGDALYGFTTFYNDSLGGKYPENRDFNIEEAVRRLQGVTIAPGEKFSYNEYCGPYTEESGYRLAKNVSRDGYGFGGGVCQVTTTIFNAIQQLNVTLDEWYLHSYTGVKYVPRNLDAAVATGRDFSFVNNEAFPLAMESFAQDGVLTVIFRRGE